MPRKRPNKKTRNRARRRLREEGQFEAYFSLGAVHEIEQAIATEIDRDIIADMRRGYREGLAAAGKPITAKLRVDYICPVFEDLLMGRSPVPMTPMPDPPPALTDAELAARDERRRSRRAGIAGIARRILGDSPDQRRRQREIAGIQAAEKTEQIERDKVQPKPPEPGPKLIPLADAIEQQAILDPEAKQVLADVMIAISKNMESKTYRVIVMNNVTNMDVSTQEPDVIQYRAGFRERYFGEVVRRAGFVEVKAKVAPGNAAIFEFHPDEAKGFILRKTKPFVDEEPRKKRGGL